MWILGYPREEIEKRFNLSHGTIQNIVDQYTIVDPLIPLLRQIGLAVRKAGLNIAEYAFNVRIIQAIARMGCTTQWVELFLKQVENEYISTKGNNVKGSIGSQNMHYKGKNFEDKNKRKNVAGIRRLMMV